MTSKRRIKTPTTRRISLVKLEADRVRRKLDEDVKLTPYIHINKGLLEELIKQIDYLDEDELREDIRFLLNLIPDWAKVVPKGLDATFYGTNTYEGDLEVNRRVNRIRKKHIGVNNET